MVDMLSEENRLLKQELEVCGEKVSKLQKASNLLHCDFHIFQQCINVNGIFVLHSWRLRF